MTEYHMVMCPEFFGKVERGVFDHWQGETIPVRSEDRTIIGEAFVKDVDHREDGNVYIVVETTLEVIEGSHVRSVADVMRGRESMSFALNHDVITPHHPRRDDDVARWLKAKRDESFGAAYLIIDSLLDEYRARADYGFTLDHDMSELEGRW
jgi:hypothetical protein